MRVRGARCHPFAGFHGRADRRCFWRISGLRAGNGRDLHLFGPGTSAQAAAVGSLCFLPEHRSIGFAVILVLLDQLARQCLDG
jgi:hypothetical protein